MAEISIWAVAAEMMRRGGRKNRPMRIAPGNIDGAVDQLRGSNQRVSGEQPIVPPKEWRKKTAGSKTQTLADGSLTGHTAPGREAAKRELDWGESWMVRRDKPSAQRHQGSGGVEESPHHLNPGEQSARVSWGKPLSQHQPRLGLVMWRSLP